MTATVTTWHKAMVYKSIVYGWLAVCEAVDCEWTSASWGCFWGPWQTAVGKALAHVDETRFQTRYAGEPFGKLTYP